MFIKKPLKFFLHLIIIIFLTCFLFIVVLFFILNRDFIEVPGEVKPDQYQVVKTKIAGILKKKYFKDGDTIKKGDLLIEIDVKEYENKLSLLQAENEIFLSKIDNEKNNIKLKKKKINIVKEKNKKEIKDLKFKKANNIITLKELNNLIMEFKIQEIDLETELLNLKNNLNQLENNLKTNETEIINLNDILEKSKVYSQIDGLIVEEDNIIKEGQLFNPEQIIQFVYSNTEMFVEAFIPEKKIIKVELNQDVKLFFNAIPYTKYKIFQGKLISLKKTSKTSLNIKGSDNNNSTFYIGKIRIDDPYFKIKNIDEFKIKRVIFGLTLNARIYVGKRNMLKTFFNMD